MAPTPGTARRPSVLRAFGRGWLLVLRAPVVTAGVLLTAFFLAASEGGSVQELFWPGSFADLRAFVLRGPVLHFYVDWIARTDVMIRGLLWLFAHDIFGFGGTVDIMSTFVDRRFAPYDLAMAGNLVIWAFLSGGILDRYARARPTRTGPFFFACGVYFFRFLRLGLILGFVYWVLFSWIFFLIVNVTGDYDAVRGAMGRTGSILCLIILVGVTVIADYTKVRAVVEDRRSMFGSIAAAIRFCRRRPVRVLGLYLLDVAAALVLLRLLPVFRGGADWERFLVASTTLVVFIVIRLMFMATSIVLFQDSLAHAGYAAAPEPVWPESPAAEAIANLAAQRQKAEDK